MKTLNFVQIIPTEVQMQEFGGDLALACPNTIVIFLEGDLGAGKTTLTRGFLRGLGYQDKVKSPTYTLVEPYEIDSQKVFHFDLYRLNDPQELVFIGVQDYFQPGTLCLIEWPSRGTGFLPSADLTCYIEHQPQGRELRLEAHTQAGKAVLQRLLRLQ